jgi:putative ABC transport system permease protein
MTFTGLLHEAWASIGGSRLRTCLATLGIVIGVGSVVLMLAIGAGSRRVVEEMIDKLGSNTLIIMARGSGSASYFSMKDLDAITELPSVVATAPSTNERPFDVTSGKQRWKASIIGTTPDNLYIRNWEFAEGESFTADDVQMGKRVAVIGATVREKLFPDASGNSASVLGSAVHINALTFQIVGTLKAKGAGMSGADQDNIIMIPITVARNVLWGRDYTGGIIQMIYAQAASKGMLDSATEDITTALRDLRKIRRSGADTFVIYNQAATLEIASETTEAFSLLLGSIASISLIVGGIGIMNIMLVTVTERTREIGLRKAIGATKRQIMLQFLLEAVIISGVGSVLGLALGIGGGLAAQQWVDAPIEYSLWSVVAAIGVAVVVGIASGLYPAYKAARLQPTEALRTAGA